MGRGVQKGTPWAGLGGGPPLAAAALGHLHPAQGLLSFCNPLAGSNSVSMKSASFSWSRTEPPVLSK